MKVWICEDHGGKAEEIADAIESLNKSLDESLKLKFEVHRFVDTAIKAIPKIEHGDLVTLDSEMPECDGGQFNILAGLKICAELRQQGKGCGIFWDSRRDLHEEIRQLGGEVLVSPKVLSELIGQLQKKEWFGKDAKPEWVELAKQVLLRLTPGWLPTAELRLPLSALLVQCLGHLGVVAAAEVQGLDRRSENPVWSDLQKLTKDSGKTSAAHAAANREQAAILVGPAGWFDSSLNLFRAGGWLPLTTGKLAKTLEALTDPSSQRRKLRDCLAMPDRKDRFRPLAGENEPPSDEALHTAVAAGARDAIVALCSCLSDPAQPNDTSDGLSETWYNLIRHAFLALELFQLVYL